MELMRKQVSLRQALTGRNAQFGMTLIFAFRSPSCRQGPTHETAMGWAAHFVVVSWKDNAQRSYANPPKEVLRLFD